MPILAIFMIVGLVTWLAVIGRKSNPGLQRSRSSHPSSPESSSVHVLHLGEQPD